MVHYSKAHYSFSSSFACAYFKGQNIGSREIDFAISIVQAAKDISDFDDIAVNETKFLKKHTIVH